MTDQPTDQARGLTQWDTWRNYPKSVEFTLEEVQSMLSRADIVKDTVVAMFNEAEAIRQLLTLARQQRQRLAEGAEMFATDYVEWLDTVILDQEGILSDLEQDREQLMSEFVPRHYTYYRRGRTNVA